MYTYILWKARFTGETNKIHIRIFTLIGSQLFAMKCLNRPIFSLRVHISFIRQLLVSFPFPVCQVQDITTCGTKNEKNYSTSFPSTCTYFITWWTLILPFPDSRKPFAILHPLVYQPVVLLWKSYKVWFKKCSSCFRFLSRSLSLLDFLTLSLIFLPVTALLSASSFRFRSFMNFESWTGPEASSVSLFLLFLFLFFSFLFFLFVLSSEESDSEVLEELLPVLLGELLFARFLLFFSFSCDGDLFLLEELDEEEFSLDWFLCFLLDFFFGRLREISLSSWYFLDESFFFSSRSGRPSLSAILNASRIDDSGYPSKLCSLAII